MDRQQRLELTWTNKDKALIPTEQGRYGYTWVDPRDPRYCETRVLTVDETVAGTRADKEEGTTYSERADLTPQEDNLLILGESGDVLEALTRVPEWSEKYVGKVKCIYIDPPFNTAQTFDNYEDNLEHSVWLTMMRDRLLHMRDLLSEDGSIWVHLDDVENHRMRVLLDEVFGASNFWFEVAVELNPKGRQLGDGLAGCYDKILVYAKSKQDTELEVGSKSGVNLKDFPLVDSNGCRYRLLPLRNTNKKFNPQTRPNLHYPLYGNPDTGEVSTNQFPGSVEVLPVFGDLTSAVWRWGLAKATEQYAELACRTVRTSDGERIDVFQKDFLSEGRTKKLRDLWPASEVGSSDLAKSEVKEVVEESETFATPKPERLLERIIHIATNPGDVVLDVFAGSGTTAAVAQKMGRRWVTCELVEDTFNRFTRPRLEKVVSGEDQGGITLQKEERADATEDGLPEGLTPEEAQKFTSLLNKTIKNFDELKKNPAVKQLKAMTKTKPVKGVVNWRGGGGFQVAHLEPACFDYDPEVALTTLTEHATGDLLVRSVAAQLRFALTPEDLHFDGKRGREHLVVVEGVLDEEKADETMAHLPDGHSVLFAATVVDDFAREHVRSFKNGSRVVHVPLEVFPYSDAAEEEK